MGKFRDLIIQKSQKTMRDIIINRNNDPEDGQDIRMFHFDFNIRF